MKNLLLTISIFLFFNAYSQDEIKPLEFDSVVYVEGASKDELYLRARGWFIETFKNEKSVISIDDKNAGEISGNGSFEFIPKTFAGSACTKGYVRFKISVYLKDGRYKFRIYNFDHEGSYFSGNSPISYGLITNSIDAPKPSRGMASQKVWDELYELTISTKDNLLLSLSEAMNKTDNTNEDW